jgi:hypothetical protein
MERMPIAVVRLETHSNKEGGTMTHKNYTEWEKLAAGSKSGAWECSMFDEYGRAARAMVPEMLAEIKRLEKALKQARADLSKSEQEAQALKDEMEYTFTRLGNPLVRTQPSQLKEEPFSEWSAKVAALFEQTEAAASIRRIVDAVNMKGEPLRSDLDTIQRWLEPTP